MSLATPLNVTTTAALLQPDSYTQRYCAVLIIITLLVAGSMMNLVELLHSLFRLLSRQPFLRWAFRPRGPNSACRNLASGDSSSASGSQDELRAWFRRRFRDAARSPGFDPLKMINAAGESVGLAWMYTTAIEICISVKRYRSAYVLYAKLVATPSILRDTAMYQVLLKGVLQAVYTSDCSDPAIMAKFLDDMRESHVTPNAEIVNTVVEAYSLLGRGDLAWKYLCESQSDCPAPAEACHRLLKSAHSAGHAPDYLPQLIEVSLGCIRRPSEKPELIHDVIDACGKFGCTSPLNGLLRMLDSQGRGPGLVELGKLITIYGEQGDRTKVCELAKRLREVGLAANEKTYGCLMESYLKCGMMDEVEATYQEMLERKLQCNVVIYTTLIRAYARRRCFYKVMAVYEKMKGDCQPNRIAYNALLDCCVKCEQYDKVSEVFQDMLRASKGTGCAQGTSDVEPDLITYSTLIKGMCKAGWMDMAMEVYQEMRGKGIQLDEVLFNSLLDGFAKCAGGTADQSDRLIEDMKTMKIAFNNYTYSILIRLYSRRHQIEKALGTLTEMKERGMKPWSTGR